eukprot:Amastigsp_a175319_881.p2 type:complete len:149 gc:universal Amastigsp_a175319_881:950-504(-)
MRVEQPELGVQHRHRGEHVSARLKLHEPPRVLRGEIRRRSLRNEHGRVLGAPCSEPEMVRDNRVGRHLRLRHQRHVQLSIARRVDGHPHRERARERFQLACHEPSERALDRRPDGSVHRRLEDRDQESVHPRVHARERERDVADNNFC